MSATCGNANCDPSFYLEGIIYVLNIVEFGGFTLVNYFLRYPVPFLSATQPPKQIHNVSVVAI